MTKLAQHDSPDGRLAAFLLDQRLISQEVLDKALEIQQASGGYLGEILVNKGLIAEDDVAFSLSEEFDIPLLSSQNGSLQPAEEPGAKRADTQAIRIEEYYLPAVQGEQCLYLHNVQPS